LEHDSSDVLIIQVFFAASAAYRQSGRAFCDVTRKSTRARKRPRMRRCAVFPAAARVSHGTSQVLTFCVSRREGPANVVCELVHI